MALPVHTNFDGSKIGNDVAIYANYGNGVIKKKLSNGDPVDVTSCAGTEECPAGSFDATVLTTPGVSAFGTLPANAPMFTAIEGETSPSDEGVLADLVCLPNPDDDFLICYDQSFDVTLGQLFRAVPRKYNSADHYVRQRAENSVRMTDLYVSNYAGLRSLNGRRCTLIAKVFPKGGGAIQETIYLSNVLLTVPPFSLGNDGNASIECSAEGSFNILAVFSAPIS